jgi:hypothetical protein
MDTRNFRKGSVMITCLIFVLLFSALAVGLATMSGANLKIADNQQKTHSAFACAESGLEVVRYWLNRVKISSSTPTDQYFAAIMAAAKADLAATGADLVIEANGSIPTVTLDAATGRSFAGQISVDPCDPYLLQLQMTGSYLGTTCTVGVQYSIEPYRFPLFNYGIATKGPLSFPQNPTMTGATESWEADIYVESAGSLTAVDIGGNANFDGNIDIGNALASINYAGDLQIAGDHGQDAIDNHVTFGADPVEFPIPNTAQFKSFATGDVVDSSTDLTKGITLTNAVIKAGTNPTFLQTVTVNGVLLIETPNVVTFDRNLGLQGLIVGDGMPQSPGENQINVLGNFASTTFPSDPMFDPLRDEAGSCILAPGFDVSFTGNFSSIDGVLAAGSVYFSANASAVVKGSIVSYSPEATRIEGNIAMNFDRASAVEIPAGFDLLRVVEYEPTSYAMVY